MWTLAPPRGIGADAQAGGADDVHVDDGGEVFDVGLEQILAMRRWGGEGTFEGNAFDAGVIFAKQCVGAVLDPFGDIDIGGAGGGWVVFESAVAGRVVGGGYGDAVSEVGFAAAVIGEDGVREDGDGGEFIVGSDDGFDAVGGEDFEGGIVSGDVDGVRILGEDEGAGDVFDWRGIRRWPGRWRGCGTR